MKPAKSESQVWQRIEDEKPDDGCRIDVFGRYGIERGHTYPGWFPDDIWAWAYSSAPAPAPEKDAVTREEFEELKEEFYSFRRVMMPLGRF